jgi:hypothetical protein
MTELPINDPGNPIYNICPWWSKEFQKLEELKKAIVEKYIDDPTNNKPPVSTAETIYKMGFNGDVINFLKSYPEEYEKIYG